ncbi:acyltransferase [Rhodoferax sp. 4810]|uniref:Acyltransferase n=1 Tax=Thiospirillum jenense TaxID=1653858 RepID=A0A839HCA0_9GAMM|nr:acyltransferase family protein [Thiospirillum jenense]MBB1072952.1 acyltransferase [Rhodoferax jenense]MBB1124898.1 acyltransferase [Thiospirillum jenense]
MTKQTSFTSTDVIGYRADIDGLRALAVIAVIINHFHHDLLPGGYLGVDIFFVISGFVITASLAQSSPTTRGAFLIHFYARRIQRLLPALIVCIIVSAILICLVDPEPIKSLRTGVAALFGVSNFNLLNRATDYFAPATELNIYTHTWSLGVEEQFYLVFPLLMWSSGIFQTPHNARRLLYWIAVLCGISVVIFVWIYAINQPAAYFLMPMRFWELGTGCLLYLGLKTHSHFAGFCRTIPLSLPGLTLFAALFVPPQWAVLATITTVISSAIIIASTRPHTITYQVLTTPVMIYIGRLSYSLYLWHWVVLAISRWTIGIHAWTVPLQLIGICAIAAASYHWIETPLRRAQWSSIHWRTISYGLVTAITAALLLNGLIALSGQISQALYPPRWDVQAVSQFPPCPFINQFDLSKLFNQMPANQLNEQSNYQPKLVVVGDSHAGQLCRSLFDALIQPEQYTYSSLTLIAHQQLAANNDFFTYDAPHSIRYLAPNSFAASFTIGDIIVFSWSRDRFKLCPFDGEERTCDDTIGLQQLTGYLDELVPILVQRGVKILFVGDVPKLCSTKTFKRGLRGIGACPDTVCCVSTTISQQDAAALNQVFRAYLHYSQVYFLDPHIQLCDNDWCQGTRAGQLLYWDELAHLTPAMGDVLSELFRPFLSRRE